MDETFLRGSERFSELLARGDVAPCPDHLDRIARSVPAAGNSCCAGHPLRDPNWLLGGGFCRSRCWLGYHYRIGNRLRNIKFLDGVKQAAQEASDRTKEQWKSILDNIPRGGTDTGAHVKETLSAHAREAQAAMRSSREAGLKV